MRSFLIMTLLLVMSLTACGSRSNPASSSLSEPDSQPQPQPEQASSSELPQSDQASASEEAADAASGPSDETGRSDAEDSEPEPITFTFMVPEGSTLAKVGMLLEEKNVCTADEFIAATQNGDFSSYPLTAAQAPNDQRCFRLEGYLYPDTYELYTGEAPEMVIHRMLTNFESKISDEVRLAVKQSGYTMDEILTLASIIEKEAFGPEQMPNISSVLHNRLETGMPLQCDVTKVYVEGAIKPFISGDVDRYSSYYNTYKCPALPAGAICNPSLDAIWAALRPADTAYLFFVTDQEKQYHYAETWEEHQVNVKAAGL